MTLVQLKRDLGANTFGNDNSEVKERIKSFVLVFNRGAVTRTTTCTRLVSRNYEGPKIFFFARLEVRFD